MEMGLHWDKTLKLPANYLFFKFYLYFFFSGNIVLYQLYFPSELMKN